MNALTAVLDYHGHGNDALGNSSALTSLFTLASTRVPLDDTSRAGQESFIDSAGQRQTEIDVVAFAPFARPVELHERSSLIVEVLGLSWFASGDCPFLNAVFRGADCANKQPCWRCKADWLKMRNRELAPDRTIDSNKCDAEYYVAHGNSTANGHNSTKAHSLLPFIPPTRQVSILHLALGEGSKAHEYLCKLAEEADSFCDPVVAEEQRQKAQNASALSANVRQEKANSTGLQSLQEEMRGLVRVKDEARENARPQRPLVVPANRRGGFGAEGEGIARAHDFLDTRSQEDLDEEREQLIAAYEEGTEKMVLAGQEAARLRAEKALLKIEKDALAEGKVKGSFSLVLDELKKEHKVTSIAWFGGYALTGTATSRFLKAIRKIVAALMEELARAHAPQIPSLLDGGATLVPHPSGGFMKRDWVSDSVQDVQDIAGKLRHLVGAMLPLETIRHHSSRAVMLSEQSKKAVREAVAKYATASDELWPEHVTSTYLPVLKRHLITHLCAIMDDFGTLGMISESVMEARHARRNRAIMRCCHIRDLLKRFQAILNVLDGEDYF